MKSTRGTATALLALPLLVALAGCGGASPAPIPGAEGDGVPTPLPDGHRGSDPDADGDSDADPDADVDPAPENDPVPVAPLAATVVVNARLVAAYAADGTQLAVVGYEESDHVAAAARLTVVLGLEPVVTTTGAIGTGCDADQTVYDFGGFLLRSPGYVGSIGPIEAEVDGAATTNGIPIVALGGARIGMTRAEFDGIAGPVTDLGSYDGRNWVGFDRINPEAEEYDAIGSLARFDDGVLAQWNAPLSFYGDC